MHGKEKVKRRFRKLSWKTMEEAMPDLQTQLPTCGAGQPFPWKTPAVSPERRDGRRVAAVPKKNGRVVSGLLRQTGRQGRQSCRQRLQHRAGIPAGSPIGTRIGAAGMAGAAAEGGRRTMKARASRSWHKEPSFASVLLVSLYQFSPGRTRQSRGILGGFPHEQQLCF